MATNGTAPATRDLLTVASGVARLNYFYGQLLTQRDLQTEQRFHLGLRRLMQRETFGTGTVAGLRVEGAGPSAPVSVFVRAGLAMDPDGRELLLLADMCVSVADPVSVPGTPYVTQVDLAGMASDVSLAWDTAFGSHDLDSAKDPSSLWPRLQAVGLTEIDQDPDGNYPRLAAQINKVTPAGPLPPGQLLRDVLFDALVGTTYLGLRYIERGTEPSPAVLDASCCGDATCFPSRREEGVVIVAQSTPFDPVPDPYADAVTQLEKAFLHEANQENCKPVHCKKHQRAPCHTCLCETLLDAWRGFPPADDGCGPCALPVVPLARVYWSRFAREKAGLSRILSVDNCSRPFAPGVPPVRALLDVLTACTPVNPVPPRFDQVTPADHALLELDASGTTATVTARATSLLKPISSHAWEVWFYPASPPAAPGSPPPPPPAPIRWNVKDQPNTPPANTPLYNMTIKLWQSTVGSPKVTAVHLQLTPTATIIPSGTYVWRLTGDIDTLQSDADLEGVFETVFYVA